MAGKIKQIVENLIRKHGTNNPFEIASQKDIVLLFEPLGGIYGYHHTFRRIQIIHINDKLDEPMKRFVCAHECFLQRKNTEFRNEKCRELQLDMEPLGA